MDESILRCVICPGQPFFSDMSHLLTHVSSKAHLAHQFKLGVRGHQEPTAASLLAEYLHWFESNNIHKLLADRISSNNIHKLLADRISSKNDRKNKRNPLKHGHKGLSTQITSTNPLSAEADDADAIQGTLTTFLPPDAVDTDADSKETSSFPEYIDPRLRESYNAVHQHALTPEEGLDMTVCSVTKSSSRPTRDIQRNHFVPSPADTVVRRTGGSGNDPPAGEADRFGTTSTNNFEPTSWDGQGAITDGFASQHASLPMTPNAPGTEGPVEGETGNDDRARELARLKGVVLPGMDVFDSAPEQMRRMRNQKKDGAIMRKLEKTSQLVEPTEQIFTPTGDLLKCRVISGNADDESPVEGESPIPKKSMLRGKRGVLRDRDPNILLGKDRKRVKRDLIQAEDTVEPDTFIYHNGQFGAAHEPKDEEMELTAQAFRKPRRAGFTVFKDTDEHDNRAPRTIGHDNQNLQSSHNTLTLSQLDLDINSNLSYNHGHTTLAEQNIEPNLDTPLGPAAPKWNSMMPFLNRSDPHISDYAPSHFSDETWPNSFLLDDQAHYGFHVNPLRGPLPAETVTFTQPSDDEDIGWPMSSDATFSDEPYHEYSQV
ncbi:hypothetical protein PEBR_36396 [Penicillium brasilianum]|uniref:Uncharacterized protein n=1 Tax=Penicillium brasilianum TaxID=104259 RepID=A0A1S9RCD0_PENBI|nr:hypothetical protein PEBR_36396 [Penicillium brasilianum]